MTECAGGHCVTCADEAVAVRVVRLVDGGLADVDAGDGRVERVSVALVDAAVGDTVLVHAKEAIGVMT
ncbi:HypC/HybG/HupF family hydrogenase formation chaperone [Actinomadura macra]|uniref:HypC/HybG/HupF family hydrogenase formation chaperone n=1 Tax=Actinomadura macra TaxID=46164 RepID=UPI00083462F3|nr:HypC/HybG/HupF family hydrogenase formation chaperone [Actinomadura macra]